jgi:hypothetical protein
MKMPEGKYVLVKDPNKVCQLLIAARRENVERASDLLQLNPDESLIIARDPSLLRSFSGIHE